MSSILDALEKADEERGLHPKELKSVSSEEKRGRLNPQMIAVAVGLIVLVNAFIWFLLMREETEPERVVVPTAEVEVPVVKAQPSVTENQPKRSSPEPKPVVSVPEQLKRTTLPSAKPLIEEAVVKKSQSRAEPRRSVEQPVESQDSVDEQDVIPPVEVAKPVIEKTPQPQLRKIPEPMTPAVQPKPEVVMAPPIEVLRKESVAAEPEAEQIPLVWELQQNLRERVLQLQSSIHVYSEIPEERFVIINMKRYQEGDSLSADGFRLERIDRNGIVIDYGRGLVRLERR
jgi:general secretion pathway protein B